MKKTRGKNLVTLSFKSDISIDMMSLSVETHLFSYWKISSMEVYQRIPLSSNSITTFKARL